MSLEAAARCCDESKIPVDMLGACGALRGGGLIDQANKGMAVRALLSIYTFASACHVGLETKFLKGPFDAVPFHCKHGI